MARKLLSFAGLTAFLNRFKGTYCGYAECSTAAGTAAKIVTLANFKLVKGAKVIVKFTVTNTAASPTLNINGTGAKAMYYNGVIVTGGALQANGIYEFIYDGTYYQLITSNVLDIEYGVCSTAAATAAKTAVVPGFVLGIGLKVSVRFSNTNTSTAPTLNINGTGAKQIYFQGVRITNEAPTLQANTIYDFIYTGTYYELIGNIASGAGF